MHLYYPQLRIKFMIKSNIGSRVEHLIFDLVRPKKYICGSCYKRSDRIGAAIWYFHRFCIFLLQLTIRFSKYRFSSDVSFPNMREVVSREANQKKALASWNLFCKNENSHVCRLITFDYVSLWKFTAKWKINFLILLFYLKWRRNRIHIFLVTLFSSDWIYLLKKTLLSDINAEVLMTTSESNSPGLAFRYSHVNFLKVKESLCD